MDMSQHPQLPQQTRPRNRDTVFMVARVAGAPSGDPQRFLVRNLSATGACIAEPAGLEKFKRLVVEIGQLSGVPAEVAWARGGFAGIRFLSPIDVARARRHKIAEGGVKTGWLSDTRRPFQRVNG